MKRPPRVLHAAAGVVAAGLLARVVVRDRLPLLSTLYYAAPPLVWGLALLLLAGGWAWAGRRGRAGATAVAAVLCLGWHGLEHVALRPQADGPLRVLAWNVERGVRGGDGVAALIAAEEPDLLLLGEVGKGADRLRAALPGHDWRPLREGLVAAVRGRILEAKTLVLEESSAASVLRVEIDGRRLTVVLVDLAADPFRDRTEVFARLDVLRAGADLVAGDFNTPRDSVHFDAWREDLVHAFEAAGRGWDATWPSPLPFLPIDHVWCGPRLVPRRCRLVSSYASDHRAVVADLELQSD